MQPVQHPLNTERVRSQPYRLVWLCLVVMLVLSGLVLLLFGVSWWTALVIVLLLACPAAMGTAIYLGFQPIAGLRNRQERTNG